MPWPNHAGKLQQWMHAEQGLRHALQESGAADPAGAADVPQVAAALMRAAAAELKLEVGGVSKL